MPTLDHTHDAGTRSWQVAANAADGDFPIQNLPLGVFRPAGEAGQAFRGGIAIGDTVLDLARLASQRLVGGLAADALEACSQPTLDALLTLGPAGWRALRHAVFDLLKEGQDPATIDRVSGCLLPLHAVEHALPLTIGDFTDFYTSFHHADNIVRLFGGPGAAPNFHHLPQAYHGRVSTIGVSGQQIVRPWGQTKPADAQVPTYQPIRALDYELELGLYVGVGNAIGTRVGVDAAQERLLGISLLNDWSARDVQGWESQPLGPFLAKNFATTVSPWIVTMDALAPYRGPWSRDARFPQPLAYLDTPANRESGALDVQLEVWLHTARQRSHGAPPVRIVQSNFKYQHWTMAQMVAHHTEGGCNLRPGDLLGTGTISGPEASQAGALIELTRSGAAPLQLDDGAAGVEPRAFLADGDSVIFKGFCARPGFARIGFGECAGRILPATPL